MAKKKSRTIKAIKKNCELLYKEVIAERDNYICQWCKTDLTGGDRHVHHIIPRSRSAYLFYDLINLILLCKCCHMKYHADTEAGVRWFETKFPARWEYLHFPIVDENGTRKPRRFIVPSSWHKSDYEKIEARLKDKLKDLKE